MVEKYNTRIDKWLWAVRIFKTRSQASKACTGRKVKIDGIAVKSSRRIKVGDIIQVRKGVIKYLYRVKKTAEKRMSAKLVFDVLEDLTPEEEIHKLEAANKQPSKTREKGQGRPTKKERRLMGKMRDEF